VVLLNISIIANVKEHGEQKEIQALLFVCLFCWKSGVDQEDERAAKQMMCISSHLHHFSRNEKKEGKKSGSWNAQMDGCSSAIPVQR